LACQPKGSYTIDPVGDGLPINVNLRKEGSSDEAGAGDGVKE